MEDSEDPSLDICSTGAIFNLVTNFCLHSRKFITSRSWYLPTFFLFQQLFQQLFFLKGNKFFCVKKVPPTLYLYVIPQITKFLPIFSFGFTYSVSYRFSVVFLHVFSLCELILYRIINGPLSSRSQSYICNSTFFLFYRSSTKEIFLLFLYVLLFRCYFYLKSSYVEPKILNFCTVLFLKKTCFVNSLSYSFFVKTHCKRPFCKLELVW